MLQNFVGEKVVIDMKAEYVCLGTLLSVDDHFLELKNADLHDLRDTDSTRENYVIASVKTGIKRNRRKLLLFRSELVAIARLEDVVDS
jgi:small nuclear ribonucleoprotein (snRNP)-like protein